jgi:hypothetical protein
MHEMCDFLALDGVDYRELGPTPSMHELANLQQRGSKTHRDLPPKTSGQLKSKMRVGSREEARELKWPGGKAGRQ